MKKENQVPVRLVWDRDAVVRVSAGYKSGRKRCLETPEMDSIASTRSAGTLPLEIQPDTVPCELKPKARAKAVCPPTALHASSNASLVIRQINAYSDKYVNADSGNTALQNGRMGKTILEPSKFWLRLEEALGEKWAPLNPNSVAKRLKSSMSTTGRMSQGSVHRWFTGHGLPELATALYMSKEAGVCVDWLLNNVKPKYPISNDPVLKELFETCEDLTDPQARDRVLECARGELSKQRELQPHDQARIGGSRRPNA